MRTLVIGVGNLYRRDDGAGIHVVNQLKKKVPTIDAIDVGLGSVEILEFMMGYERVIIVDAIVTGAEPGSYFHVNISTLDDPPLIFHSHGIDLITTLKLGNLLYSDQMPKELMVIGIEVEDTLTMSEECTPRVREAVKNVVDEIIVMVAS
jgi:hydrogenase maturation protease